MKRSTTVVLPTPASPDNHTTWRRPAAAAVHAVFSRASTSARPTGAGTGGETDPFSGSSATGLRRERRAS
jgi:hypothetical protein